MTLTQKETSLLKDLKDQEELCIEKYGKYAQEACDAHLKNLFTQIQRHEQAHLNTVNLMLQGNAPAMGGGQQQPISDPVPVYTKMETDPCKQKDCYLCRDALAMEKHVSGVYDISIFEFSDRAMRDALNHIQKEEQEHGKKIYDYMSRNGMYEAG